MSFLNFSWYISKVELITEWYSIFSKYVLIIICNSDFFLFFLLASSAEKTIYIGKFFSTLLNSSANGTRQKGCLELVLTLTGTVRAVCFLHPFQEWLLFNKKITGNQKQLSKIANVSETKNVIAWRCSSGTWNSGGHIFYELDFLTSLIPLLVHQWGCDSQQCHERCSQASPSWLCLGILCFLLQQWPLPWVLAQVWLHAHGQAYLASSSTLTGTVVLSDAGHSLAQAQLWGEASLGLASGKPRDFCLTLTADSSRLLILLLAGRTSRALCALTFLFWTI